MSELIQWQRFAWRARRRKHPDREEPAAGLSYDRALVTPSPTIAHIEPEVLRWARESAGYSIRRAADRIGVEKWYLELVEGGGELLTLRQAEKAAEVYERPLASLFLPNAPAEEPQEVQFRRLPGAPEPPWGPEIQLSARRITERQQTAVEIYEVLEEEPPWPAAAETLAEAPRAELPELVRALLGVSREEQRDWGRDAYAPLRGWRDAVEAQGILVIQEGPVPVQEMRGFASIEPPEVPAILVNNKDDPRSRAFTLLHEFGHVLLARRGELTGQQTERWCEEFAGEVLMPREWLYEEFEASGSTSTLGRVQDVARAFHVTPLAAAVRVARSNLVTREDGGAVIGEIRRRWVGEEEDEAGGGSYYVNQVARFGPGYLRLVFSALDANAVTLPTASTLLQGVKVKNFDTLRDHVEGRR